MTQAATTPFELPEHLLQESFLAGTGPGGQNVNKVATTCQLRVNIFALCLAPYAFRKLKILAGSKMTQQGDLIITARTYRSREDNRAEARRRLKALLQEAHKRQAHRVATRPSRTAKAKRVDAKKSRGTIKQSRQRVSFD